MQISAHKLKGTGALLHLGNQIPFYCHQSEVISNTQNMRKYMLHNTATSINSNNNNNRNHSNNSYFGFMQIMHFTFPNTL